jgi:hypothetical protein
MLTPCIKCGKMRVLKKSVDEVIAGSTVTYSYMVCPDSECQKSVDEQMRIKQGLIDSRAKDSLKRRQDSLKKKRVSKK